ncbi:MAG: nitroreductase family protein [Verrucomicrobiota bacterium JB022]|nr:nitroreductase family protein [Verrucomicrobiota bacterium JB022]
MDTLTAINERRAVKAYDPAHQMTDAEVRQLMDYVRKAPTAFNLQNWRFVLVRNPELRRQIRAAAWDQAQVTDASLLVVLTADLKAWQDLEEPLSDAPQPVKDYFKPAIKDYYEGKERVQIDEAHRSCGLAGATLMLAAKALGYETSPMDGFDFQKVGELIRLPKDHVISFMIAVGKGIKPAQPKLGWRPYDKVVLEDTF